MSSFPQSFESTISHWQATNRGRTALWNHNRHAKLPAQADIVVVGGGITGASLAYHLTRQGAAGEGKTVIVLEAKDLASGATGRNGGHIAPASFTAFLTLVGELSEGGSGLSEEDALDVLENEQDTIRCAQQIVKDEAIDADLWVGSKLEVQVTPEGVQRARKAWAAYNEARQRSPRYRHEPLRYEFIDDPVKARKLSRAKNALSVVRMPAGSCHPHRLATALMRKAMGSSTSHCEFFSWAPAQRVEKSSQGWTVPVQGRGSIQATNVILATNAHTTWLLPEGTLDISKHITPFRGHAALVVPPASASGQAAFETTYSLEQGPYMMSTPHSGLVLGCYNVTALAAGIARRNEIWGVTDDSVVLPAFRHWLENYCERTFRHWSPAKTGEGISRVWSGIMGASRDLLPLVGEIPGSEGLYAAVAFNGHGMARILTATRGLAFQMKHGNWDDRLPRVFAITEERLRRAQQHVPDLLRPEDIADGTGGIGELLKARL